MASSSIKSFLVLNLLLSVTLVSTIAIVGNLFLEHQGFQKNLDSQLSLTAQTITAFTNGNTNYQKIQNSINKISKNHAEHASVQYLITDSNGKVLLQSHALPKFNINEIKPGYNDLWLKHRPWRLLNEKAHNNLNIFTLQRHDFRAKLEREITQDSFIIMLITYPFLGLLIWAVVNKGLSDLESATKSLRKRKRSNLKPLAIKNPPTEIAPLIKAINSLLSRLEASFQREQRFAGDAAHELRTPLAALSAHLQLAQTETEPKKIQAALEKFSLCVERSSHVVDQLLTLSRMSPGSEINDPETIELRELAQLIIIELLPLADKKQIELELTGKISKTMTGNRAAILILLRNLVDNAIRYSPEHSKVTINLSEQNKQIILQVRDEGPGIPEELKKRVFERFFRVVGNNTKGSGLGLGIVQEIINFHNAKISLNNINPGLNVEIRFQANDV